MPHKNQCNIFVPQVRFAYIKTVIHTPEFSSTLTYIPAEIKYNRVYQKFIFNHEVGCTNIVLPPASSSNPPIPMPRSPVWKNNLQPPLNFPG
jgi:hypothetical protein